MNKHNELTLGYMDGINGLDPKSNYPGSSYERGWLLGSQDREKGIKAPKYFGYHEDKDLPIKPGMTVTIKKGTLVHCNGVTKPAGRTYKVKVNHLFPGSDMWVSGNAFRSELNPITNPRVRWAGKGCYWAEADINDIPEAF